MANATITGTASNFGSISGVLAGDAGTVAGSVTGVITGTLGGSVGVPGPGVPADGLEGQILAKASDTSYDTEWQDNYATELRIVARNETGSTLAKGTVVYINGAAGNKPTLAKALATGDATSAQTVGMVSADILNNQNGEVTVRGLLTGLDTSAYAAGTQLYLSGTTAGAVTSTKPSAPIHLVYVGIVSRQHVNQGQVEVAVMNGFELHELHDVKITSVSNGQVLKYDSAQGLWVNGTDSAGVAWGGITGTLSSQTDLQTALDAKATATDYLSKAGNLSGLADTATARSNLGLGTMATATASDYSTTTVANGLYYPLSSNPAGYLTSSALTGYATESWVTTALGSYLTTASASSTYLTQSNAASTYQTQAGMSSYLTTSAAASTYQTQAGMSAYLTTATASSTYLTQANAATTYYPLTGNPSGFLTSAPVTSVAGKTGAVTLTNSDISGLGTMATATASDYLAKADNLSGIANTGTARTNLGLGTIATVNDAPSDGTTYGRNNGAWVTAGGAASVDYQEFTTSGSHTWTKPANAKLVHVIMFGGGGGGGSGARYGTTGVRGGGGGGGGGSCAMFFIGADALGSTETVVVGAGGTGATAITADNTQGNNGGGGGDSTFFNIRGVGGGGGQRGTSSGGGLGGSGTSNSILGFVSSTSTNTGGQGTIGVAGTTPTSVVGALFTVATSGGGGAGQNNSVTTSLAGGAGQGKAVAGANLSGRTSTVSGGAAGTTGGTAPTSGTAGNAGMGGTGGGGGAYRTAVAGMAGADGASPGGGGGGGSASDNGNASGAGGNGGVGRVTIITYID